MQYSGTPHENLSRLDGLGRAAELNQMWPNEAEVRLNVRPVKRDKKQFLLHYLSYYVGTPWGANHMILGLDKNGDSSQLFPQREARRLAFRELCRKTGIPLKANKVCDYMTTHREALPEEFKQFVREEKILNDVWRYYVLLDDDIVDDHDHKNMVKIS